MGREEERRVEMEGEGNMCEWNGQVGGRTERENKERDTLIEGAIMGLGKHLTLGKLPGIHKDDPS